MLTRMVAHELEVQAQPEAWLQALPGPAVIEVHQPGTQQWCVVSGLIHGNEPSGFYAIHRLLRAGVQAPVNVALIVSSLSAARLQPPFTHRQRPGHYDLNRRFGMAHGDDVVTRLARDITAYIREKNPLWVLDLHNTSGSGPAFAVSVNDCAAVRQLALPFTGQMIITHLVVGSLMEQNFNCPVVTIECGGADDPKAHQLAFDGLQGLLSKPHLPDAMPAMSLVEHPVRVVARANCRLVYGQAQTPGADITLRADIEQANWSVTAAGTRLGWCNGPLNSHLTAINEFGENVIAQLFDVVAGEWVARRDMQLFMATSRADIALSDCLFYVG